MQQSLNLLPDRSTGDREPADDVRAGVPPVRVPLFVAFAVIVIAWHGIRMMFSHDALGEHMFDFAKLLLFVSFGYALIAFYEIAAAGHRRVVQQPDHGPGALLPAVLEARAFDNIYRHFDELSAHFVQPDAWSILANLFYWTVMLLIAVCEGGVAGGHRLRIDRERRVRAARTDLRAVLHRAEARLAVLGLVQVLHPVLVHPSGRDRVSDDLRTVHLPVRDDAAADHHARRVRRLRPAGVRGHHCILWRDPARAIADPFDLLGSSGESILRHAASPWAACFGVDERSGHGKTIAATSSARKNNSPSPLTLRV